MKSFYKILLLISILFGVLIADDTGLKKYKDKKYEEAKAYYEHIIAEHETDAAASLGLGASQYQLGNIPEATKSFEEVIRSEETEIQDRAYYNLGNILYNQQKKEESVAFYRKALELNPYDEDAKFNYELAKYFAQQEDQQPQEEPNDQQDQNEPQDDPNKDNNQDNDSEDTENKEPDKQDEAESDKSEEEEREAPKSQKQINAEAILDALKEQEKIHQKVKMAQQSARKLEKDW